MSGHAGVRVIAADVHAGWVELATPYGKMRGERHDGPEFATSPTLPVAYTVTLRQEMGDPAHAAAWLTWLDQARVQSRSVGQEELARWGNAAAPLDLGAGSAGVGLVCLTAYDLACDHLLGASDVREALRIAWSQQQIEDTQWAMDATEAVRQRAGQERQHPVEQRLARAHLVHSMNLWRLTDPVISQHDLAQHLLRELADQEWVRVAELRETVLALLREE